MRPNAALGLTALLLAVACGAAQEQFHTPPPPTRVAIADANLRRLFLDVASTKACTVLRDKFVSLPSDAPNATTADGTVPISGRWLVRACRVSIDSDSLHLVLDGPGWQWVDQYGDFGFHVKQYVYFNAHVELRGALDVGYDPSSHIASVWLTPTSDVVAHVDPLGEVNARHENVAASLVAFVAGQTSIDAKARAHAGDEGAKKFRARLTNGVTITFDATTAQLDLVVGQLANGLAPRRPFPNDGASWLVNERKAIFSAGVDVAGPFEGVAYAMSANVTGAKVAYRAVCANSAVAAVDAIIRRQSSPALLAGEQILDVGLTSTNLVLPSSCSRWVLAMATTGTTSVVDVVVRPTENVVDVANASATTTTVTPIDSQVVPTRRAWAERAAEATRTWLSSGPPTLATDLLPRLHPSGDSARIGGFDVAREGNDVVCAIRVLWSGALGFSNATDLHWRFGQSGHESVAVAEVTTVVAVDATHHQQLEDYLSRIVFPQIVAAIPTN